MTPIKNIRVSYILTTRNRAEFLERTLKNVREFITDQDELIITDGASTDGTREVVERNRDIINVFDSQRDSGEAHGFNRAVLHARGRFIKPITDDDYFFPKAMADAIATMEDHPELDAVLCGGTMYVSEGPGKEPTFKTHFWLPPTSDFQNVTGGFFAYTDCGLGLLLARRVMARVGLFDPTFRCVDTDYLSRLVMAKVNFRYLNLNLYRHTRYPHSGSTQSNDWLRDHLRVLIRHQEWNAARSLLSTHPKGAEVAKQMLGLEKIEGADSILETLWFLSKLQEEKQARIFLPFIAMMTGAFYFVFKYLQRVRRLVPSLPRPSPSDSLAANASSEPIWDGSLR